MSAERGPAQTFEIVWQNGHVDRIPAHQVAWPGSMPHLFGEKSGPQRVTFHAEIDGHWTLMLSALESDIRTIRNLATERLTTDGES